LGGGGRGLGAGLPQHGTQQQNRQLIIIFIPEIKGQSQKMSSSYFLQRLIILSLLPFCKFDLACFLLNIFYSNACERAFFCYAPKAKCDGVGKNYVHIIHISLV